VFLSYFNFIVAFNFTCFADAYVKLDQIEKENPEKFMKPEDVPWSKRKP